MNSKLNLVILECVNVFSKRYKNYLLQTFKYLGNSEFVALDKLKRVGWVVQQSWHHFAIAFSLCIK